MAEEKRCGDGHLELGIQPYVLPRSSGFSFGGGLNSLPRACPGTPTRDVRDTRDERDGPDEVGLVDSQLRA
ncbi:MAG: hypothetical protein EWM73_03339 [Nitrospira sp.]|nr:MAG: hypothetical protein EWM73_03339 [Nitrospira sp.]